MIHSFNGFFVQNYTFFIKKRNFSKNNFAFLSF